MSDDQPNIIDPTDITVPNVGDIPDVDDDLGADIFDEWIAGATIARRSVPIYGKPGLIAEYEDLERQLEVARSVEAQGGAELGGSTVAGLEARLRDIYEQWMASKSTWTLRMLEADEMDKVLDDLVKPVLPVPAPPVLPARATEQQKRSHTIAEQKYEKDRDAYLEQLPAHEAAVAAYNDERNLRIISAGVVKIEFADGRTKEADVDESTNQMRRPAVTVAQLRAMRAKLGIPQMIKLINTANLTLVQEPTISPFVSRSDSANDPT